MRLSNHTICLIRNHPSSEDDSPESLSIFFWVIIGFMLIFLEIFFAFCCYGYSFYFLEFKFVCPLECSFGLSFPDLKSCKGFVDDTPLPVPLTGFKDSCLCSGIEFEGKLFIPLRLIVDCFWLLLLCLTGWVLLEQEILDSIFAFKSPLFDMICGSFPFSAPFDMSSPTKLLLLTVGLVPSVSATFSF